MDAVISVQNFSKSFGRKKIINDLSFDVLPKDVFAFLGANGSGKTTTIRTLLGIYTEDKGSLLINNVRYTSNQSSTLGYLPEERGLYLSSRVLETMIYFGRLKGMTLTAAKKKAIDYLERVELLDKKDAQIKKLSSGQQQKIQLGITIINSPGLLILDEPTKGLDPVNRELLLEILKELNKKGSTIMFSTHQMEEAEKIATKILMIKNGEAKLYGEINAVKKAFGNNVIRMEYSGEFTEKQSLFDAKVEKNYAEICPKENVDTNEILSFLLSTKKLKIEKFEIGTPSLNQIFIQVSKEK